MSDALEAAAFRAVDAAENTDDGMVLIKWDEFIPLADAVHNLRATNDRPLWPSFTWPARAIALPEQIEAFISKAMGARPPDTDINTWELGEVEHVIRDGLWVLTVEWKPVLR